MKSKVCIIANVWKALNTNIEAVEDRGILVHFAPTAQEVHSWAGEWRRRMGVSDDVFAFIEKHLEIVSNPSGRHYVTAQQVKDAGMDWRAALLETWGITEEKALVVTLENDASLTAAERVKRFENEMGQSRATYYRLRDELGGGRGTRGKARKAG